MEKFFAPQNFFDRKIIFALEEKGFPSLAQFLRLPKILTRQEKFLIIICLVIFFSSLTLLVGRLYFKHTAIAPANGGVYTEGLVGSPRYVNPLFASVNDVDADIAQLIFSGLLRFSPQKGYMPDLAESYEVSEDQKVYTFRLRQNIKWHDGAPFFIDDVFFTINAAQNSDYSSPAAKSFAGVALEKVDEKTIRFRLQEPFVGFRQALTIGILPEHIWGAISPSAAHLAEINLKPIGTGPFRFKSFVRSRDGNVRSYTLARNEDFYGQKPYLDKIVFRFYPDTKSAAMGLGLGEVDGINLLPPGEKIDKQQNIVYYSLVLPQYTAIFFNLKGGNTALTDKNVRQALAHATNKEKILREALGGEPGSPSQGGQILGGPIPRGFIGFHAEAKKYDFNPLTAETLLDKAGWKRDDQTEEKRRKKNNVELEITLTAIGKGEQYHLAEIIKENWERVGVKVNLNIVPGAQIQKTVIRPRLYDALIYGEILGPESDLLPYWHSSQVSDPGLNLSGFSNALADKYLEELRKITNISERAKKFIALQNILMEEAPAIFLYSPTFVYPVSKRIKGIDIQYIIIPKDRFSSIESWFVKQKRVFKK